MSGSGRKMNGTAQQHLSTLRPLDWGIKRPVIGLIHVNS